ncbi:MAG: nucleotidyltransferase family protein [Myxococcales bacterium]|nr:nucleotidyltransferase family protein [Myxococcales bacterium]
MEHHFSLHAILLAAGSSRRMGTNKLLLPWPDAENVLTATLAALLPLYPSPLQSIHVVTGHESEKVEPFLREHPIQIVHNPHHLDGMLSSLQTGLQQVPAQADVAMILPADLPLLQTHTLRHLLTFLPIHQALAPAFQGQRGHPVFLPRHLFEAMLALPKGAQPRDIFRQDPSRLLEIPLDSPEILADIDTPEAYQRALHSAR